MLPIVGLSAQEIPYKEKWKCLKLAIEFAIANNVEGNYYEFGIYKGDSFIFANQHFLKEFNRYKSWNSNSTFLDHTFRFFAFDSFEGLPADRSDPYLPAHWANFSMSSAQAPFVQRLQKYGIDLGNVEIIPGFFSKTFNEETIRKCRMGPAAVIHIDCDLYESTVEVFDFMTEFFIDGTVIVFDDFFYYRAHPQKGERGVFLKWLREHPEWDAVELCKECPTAAFIINKIQ